MYYLDCGTSFEDQYKKTLQAILKHGRYRDVRGFKTKELSPYVFTTYNPLRNVLTNPIRNINRAFMRAEFLWIMSGRNDNEMIGCYNSQIGAFADNQNSYRGAYGPMIQRQFEYIMNTLISDPGSRQAIIQIWQPNPGKSKDVPCTLSMQFLRDDNLNALDLIVTMRSNDAWLGLPYDFYNFTMIQNYMAMKLCMNIGRYTHIASSEHLYDTFYFKAHEASLNPTIRISDIEESDKFTSDELLKTLEIENKMRNLYRCNKLSTDFLSEYTGLSIPWFFMIQDMHQYLLKKNK